MPLPTAKRRFTEQMLERMNPPKVGRLELGDSLCPGLVLRVAPQGTKTLAVIYRVHGEGGLTARGRPRTGRQHRVTLGRWPVIKLTDAREKARGILAAAGEGRNVRAEQRATLLARQENTLSTAVRRYIEQDARLAISSWSNAERVLRLHVLPILGDRQIGDIRRSDVHTLLDDIVTSGRTGTAREVRKHLLRLFGWALDREIIFSNPLDGLKRADLTANGEAGRALTDMELKAIWKASQEMAYPFGKLYQALMLTGQRRAEWAASKRSEINEEQRLLEVPKARHKSSRDHVIPLMGPAWELYKGLPVWSGDDPYVFSTRAGRKPISGFSRVKARLDDFAQKHLRKLTDDPAAELAPFRIHDLRVTCETRLAHLGFGQEVRDAVLGHAKPGLQKTYNKHDYLEEKREALAAYGEHTVGIVG